MSQEKDHKAIEPLEAPKETLDNVLNNGAAKQGGLSQEMVTPEISAFFSNPKVSSSAFFQAVKAEKIKRFKKEDEERAFLALKEDEGGERLWALISQAKIPDAVDRWVWPAAQDRLKGMLGADFNPHESTPAEILNILRVSFEPNMRSKDKAEKKRAENWLRIGICWLVEKRSIELWSLAESLSGTFFADTKQAKTLVRRAIGKGSSKEFRISVATVKLSTDFLARSKSELAEERRIANNLRFNVTEAEKKIENLEGELSVLRRKLEQEEDALLNLKKQFENERHHWGHDLSEAKAGQRVLLAERVVPYLSDAVDALEIDTPAPDVALKRVKAVLKIIDEANS